MNIGVGNSRKVLVFRQVLLPRSETFIREQVRVYARWNPVLVGVRKLPELSLGDIDTRILPGGGASMFARASRAFFRRLAIGPPAMTAALKRERAALLHVHFGTDAVDYWPLFRNLALPVVITLHGYDINIYRDAWRHRGSARRDYPEKLLALARQPCVHIVAVSDSIRRRALEFGIPDTNMHVRHIGVDTLRFVPADTRIDRRPRRIVYVGRMIEKKGGAFLIEAFARVKSSIPEAELVMIGDGPLLPEYKRLAARTGVAIDFPGALTSSQVKKHLDGARIFCLPSITASDGDAEGLPIVILEAQACGVPVVTSARGCAGEAVDGDCSGIVFAERDVPALEGALAKLLRDDELLLRMSEAARRHMVNQFDLRQCTASLEALYDRIVGSTPVETSHHQ